MDAYLSSLVSGLEILSSKGELDLPVKGISIDSSKVEPGSLFFCLRGLKNDGHFFAAQAASGGAAAVCCERLLDIPGEVTQIIVKDARAALADVSSNFFGFPSRKFELVGVTGTNGKTTTCFFLESIFKQGGLKTGLIGTVEIHMVEEVLPVTNTTPEPLHLQGLFRQMADCGVGAVSMEVSSHAIDQNRIRSCDFDVVAFTNLSRDHLDYHESMENYYRAKKKLFQQSEPFGERRSAVLNIDDEAGARIAMETDLDVITVGRSGADLSMSIENIGADGSTAVFEGLCFDREKIEIKIPGDFNVMNALTAAAAAFTAGVDPDAIKEGIQELRSVPGRFERVDGGEDFAVIVDYAHTPDSLEKTLRSARLLSSGRVISVFGCGGDRDRDKRQMMGEASAKMADFTIITSDNPRSEEPESIIDQIEKSLVLAGAKYCRISDRREAIGKAIEMAGKGDFVIIAGKGHEKGQIFADKVMPFDDREVAREVLAGVLP